MNAVASPGFRYSRGYGKFDNTPDQRAATDFASFREAVLADRATDRGQQWIAGPCAVAPNDELHRSEPTKAAAIGRPHRCKSCALPRHWIGVDIDGAKPDRPALTPESFSHLIQVMQPYSGFVYTTGSHTDAAPRARAIFELDQSLPRAELIRVARALQNRVDAKMVAAGCDPVPWDSACDKPEQPLYLPLVQSRVYLLDGLPLAAGDLLADVVAESAAKATDHPSRVQAAQADAYALAALDHAMRAISAAPHGSRNDVLNREAYGLGGLAAQGRLNRTLVETALVNATVMAGWDNPDLNIAKIKSGISSGRLHPRTDGLPSPLAQSIPFGSSERPDELIRVELKGLRTATVQSPRFALYPIVPRGVVTLLAGHGGSGKSTVALTLCAHAACGRSWASFACDGPQRVVFVSLEDPGELVRYRLRGIVEANGLDWDLVERNLIVLDGAEIDAALVRECSEAGARHVKPTARMTQLAAAVAGALLIAVDNASDAFDGDENNRRQVRAFIRWLAQMARTNDAGLILLAHIDKNAAMHGSKGNSYSGSTAWHNSARSRLAMVTAGAFVEFWHEKANLSGLAGKVTLEWRGDGVLLPIDVEPANQQESPLARVKADADSILLVFGAAADVGIAVPSATKGPSTAIHVLEQLPELAHVYRSRSGRRRVEAALVQLQRDKRLTRLVIKTASRNTREVFELTHAGVEALQILRASNPRTPGVTDARAKERASDISPSSTRETHATDATDETRAGFTFSPHGPGVLFACVEEDSLSTPT